MGLKIFYLYLFISKRQTTCPRDVFVFISSTDGDPGHILQEHPYLRRLTKKMALIACGDHPTYHNLLINENITKALPINFQEIVGAEEDFFYIGMVNGGLDECGHKLRLRLICLESCLTCNRMEGHFCNQEIKLTNVYI